MVLFVFFWSDDKFIIPLFLQAHHLFIDPDTSPSINGGVDFLTVLQNVTFPVGETFCFADTLTEEVGIDLHETLVFNTDFPHELL